MIDANKEAKLIAFVKGIDKDIEPSIVTVEELRHLLVLQTEENNKKLNEEIDRNILAVNADENLQPEYATGQTDALMGMTDFLIK